MSEKIKKVQIIEEPLRIVFYYKSGNNKAGSVETLTQSEQDNAALAKKRMLPEGHVESFFDRNCEEPFFTSKEVEAAKHALAEHNFRKAQAALVAVIK